MTKLLYIPNGVYVTANINGTNGEAERLLQVLIKVSPEDINELWLRKFNLPENHKFSEEEFEIVED